MVVHAVRQSGDQHIVVGHPNKTIQARQLLGGLPGALPSIVGGIPVLGPILGGGQSSPPPPPPAPPPPSPSPTAVQSPSAPSSTAPPNGGGSHSGGSGGSSSGNGPSSGNGNGGKSGKGSSSGGSSGSTTTAGAPQDPSPTTNSGTSTEISQPGNPASSAAAGSVLTGNQPNGSSSSTSSTVPSGGQSAPKNVPLPDTIQSSGYPVISGSPSGVAPSDPSSTNGTNDVGTNNDSSALANNKHRLSHGAIAAIVIVLVLFLLLIVVFILRRRSKKQRDERTHKWWFVTNRSSRTYGDLKDEEIMPGGTRTARSSFVTTVDHSATHTPYLIPPFPPAMAEVGRGNGARPTLIINTHEDSNNNDPIFNFEETRFSIGSAGSEHSQYLIVHNRNSANPDLLGGTTPMSVRPFSPSESFAFPKPPEPAAGSASGSRPSSAVTIAGPSTASLAATPPPDLPDIPTFPLAVPFTAVSTNTNHSSPTNTIVARTSDPFADNNPFEDTMSFNTTTPTIVHSTAAFSEVEIVRRPFVPTLPDELSVKPDDTVRVLHSFDDGWALVETVVPPYPNRGKVEKGLIPIDCLRKPGQNLPAFIASKRVSSYGEQQFVVY